MRRDRLSQPCWLVLAALALCNGCGPAHPPDAEIVATVGGDAILADDFAASFELGFPHLKGGADPRRAYLDRMIDEKLLALEGYRLGLDTTEAVRTQVSDLIEELLVEQVFEREVNARLAVSDADVEAALRQEAVRFRLRYVPAATHAEAEALRARIATEGFETALAQHLARHPEAPFRPGDFVTPYLTAAEVPPTILTGVRDLPVGMPSAPLRVAGQYLIVEVLDVTQAPVAFDAASRHRARQVLEQQQARQDARAYVKARMTPLDVRIKAGAFRRFSRALWAWYRTLDGPPVRLAPALARAQGAEAEALRQHLGDVVATTRDSTITAGALLAAFPARRYALSTRDEAAFRTDLYDAVGLTLRDAVFVAQAQTQKLDEQPSVTRDVARWRDKWVYQAMLQHLADTVRVTDTHLATYRTRHASHYAPLDAPDQTARLQADVRQARLRAALPEVLKALRQRYPVAVRGEALAAAVPDTAVTAGVPALLFKAHTGRPIYPIVDPMW